MANSLTSLLRLAELLGKYGNEKFGNEWWPGHADAYLGQEEAIELGELLEFADKLRRA